MPTAALRRLDAPDAPDAAVPVLAYALDGKMNADDFALIWADLREHDRIRLLVQIDTFAIPDPSAFSAGLIQMKKEALHKLDRYAIVGGPDWFERYASLAGGVSPFPIRRFESLAEARAWISADPLPGETDAPSEDDDTAGSPAVTLLRSPDTHIVAFHIQGRLTSADYRTVLVPAIEEALARHDAIDLLVRFGDLYGFSLGAARHEAALAQHVGSLRRVALVNAPGWLSALSATAGGLLPVDVKAFDDETPARRWLTGS